MFHHQHRQISHKGNKALEKEEQRTNTTVPQVNGMHPATLVQRAKNDPSSLSSDEVLTLQKTMGNRAATQLFTGTSGQRVQPKLTIGEPGDKYEQEADRQTALTQENSLDLQLAFQASEEEDALSDTEEEYSLSDTEDEYTLFNPEAQLNERYQDAQNEREEQIKRQQEKARQQYLDHLDIEEAVSEAFYDNHLIFKSSYQKKFIERGEDAAKTRERVGDEAKERARERSVPINTAIVLTLDSEDRLIKEVVKKNRNGEYNRSGTIHTTDGVYQYVDVTNQQHLYSGKAKFRYAINYDVAHRIYIIHHFDGIS